MCNYWNNDLLWIRITNKDLLRVLCGGFYNPCQSCGRELPTVNQMFPLQLKPILFKTYKEQVKGSACLITDHEVAVSIPSTSTILNVD